LTIVTKLISISNRSSHKMKSANIVYTNTCKYLCTTLTTLAIHNSIRQQIS